jgi:hypothetical protein
MKLAVTALVASLGAFAAPATAQGISSEQQLLHACGGDVDRLCPGVPPGEGRIKACMKACMKAHASELSAGCFDTLMAAMSVL